MFGYKNKEESGAIVINGEHTGYTVQCVHCGEHWEIVPGSKRKRGYCFNCAGPTCGSYFCFICVPFEARLEYIEYLGWGNTKKMKEIETKYPEIKELHRYNLL